MEDEGPPPAEAQVQDGPLASRIESKAWKTRMEAYVELTQLVEAAEDAEVAQEYAGKLVKMVVDTNLNAQQKGIEVASACARKMNVDAVAGWVHSVMAKTVDKAFGQVKCKGTAQELAMLLIEAEQGEMVIEELLKGCSHKQPKVVHAAVECVRMAVQGFGLKALGPTPKPVVKLSVALLEASATTAPVRAEAKLLAVELHRYMGAALRPSYDNLRPAQQKDLDDAFAEAPKAKPTRMTRAVAAAAAARLAAGEPEEEVADAGGGEGEFEIEAVDVLAKLPKDFNEKIFTVAKWTEKKEMLDELVKLANSPKVAPGDFAELTKTLKRLTGDSMVVVVATSIQALAALAKGLKKDFAQYARNSTSTLFDRLKEKDRRVVEACHTALDAYLAGCVSVTDMVDDLTVALGPKGIPKSKSEVLKFLTRSIDSKVAAFVPKTHKPVFEAIIKGTEDAAPDIREGSFIVLAALIKACGADVMRAPLASLDDKRRKKIEALAGSDGAPAPAAAAAPKATAPKKVVKSAAASDAPAKAKGGAKAAKAKESKDEAESETAGVSTEELDTLVQTLIADDVRAKLKSSNWKERLEAIERLEEDAKANAGEMAHPAPEAWVRLLAVSFVERKETNFQVLNKVHLVVATLAEKAPKFTKRAAHWFIPHMIEKLGDVKLKQGAHDALLTIAEAATPQFVLNQGFEATKKQKAPKTIESALLWVNAMVADFGHKLIKAKPLLEMVKGMLEHANPGVKKASVEILVSMRRQLGPELRSQLADVKPALLTSIDEAFAKVAEEAPVVPRRGLKGADGEDGGEEVAEVQEVVSLTTPIAAHIKGLSDANWKERQASITAIDELVSKAKPLGCTGPYMEGACGELWGAMKARLKDLNKNLAIQVLALLGKIAGAVGPSVERYAKFVMPHMLALVADNKKQVREDVIACLSAWAEQISIETVLKHLPLALSVEAPAGREDSAKWASEYLRARVDKVRAGVDLSPILSSVMESLCHRVTEVRNAAEACLAAVIACGGKQLMEMQLRDVKPAQLKSLRPLCDKAERAAASIVVVSAPAAAAADEAKDAPSPERASAPAPSKAVEAVAVKRPGTAVAAAKEEKAEKEREAAERAAEKAAVAALAAEEAALAEKAILKSNAGKEGREKKRGNRKWVLGDAKEVEELLGTIREQMTPVVQEEVMASLFHKDFKKQVDGIKAIAEYAPTHPKEVTENLDLLLRLCALRLAGKLANTTVVLSILEFLKGLLDLLVANDYRLSEAEATVLLPCLMEEVGSNSDGVRKHTRELLKKATQVYPASKIFGFAMDTLNTTRNQRSRAENLAEMAALIDRLGLDQVCMPSRALPAIASYVAERDALVRNAACDCLAAAYGCVGERLWKLLPKLEPKEKDILEARLRKVKASGDAGAQDMRKSMTDLASSAHAAAHASPNVRASMPVYEASPQAAPPARPDNILDLLEAPTPSISHLRSRFQTATAAAAAPPPPPVQAQAPAPVHVVRQEEETSPNQTVIHTVVDPRMLIRELAAASGSDNKVEVLKKIGDSITEKSNVGVSWGAPHADALVENLHEILAEGLDSPQDEGPQRTVKYALHIAHLAFNERADMTAALSETVLGRLMEEVLVRLHDPALTDGEGLEMVMRGMNELVMDLLHKANPNHVFTVLIRSLYEGAPLSGGREATPLLVDGVLRCLLEMARRMPSYLDALEIDVLLYDAHMFLVAHPPSKYRGKEFRPLRLLKTILNELVKSKGEAIRSHLTLVPGVTAGSKEESKPTICSYIDLVLTQHNATRGGAPAQKVAAKTVGNLCLPDIFEKIQSKDKDLAKEGFKLLYQYTRATPEFDLAAHMKDRSPQFQEHVFKNFTKVQTQQETAAAQHSAPSSLLTAPSASAPLTSAAPAPAPATAALPLPPSPVAAAMPLQNVTSMANSSSRPSTAGGSSNPTAGLMDKIHGMRSQLGISGARPSTGPTAEAEDEAGAPLSASSSVLSLQERLARLRS